MTVADVAAYLQIAPKTVRNKVSLRQLPFVKVGGALRFRRADIDAELARQTRNASAA